MKPERPTGQCISALPWRHVYNKDAGTSAVFDANEEIICGSMLITEPAAVVDAHRLMVHAVNSQQEYSDALKLLLQAFDALLPGAKHIAVDIGLLNDAAIKARPLVERDDA